MARALRGTTARKSTSHGLARGVARRMGLDDVDVSLSATDPTWTCRSRRPWALSQGRCGAARRSTRRSPTTRRERPRRPSGCCRRAGHPVPHPPAPLQHARFMGGSRSSLPLLSREGVGCVCFSPLARGLLTNRYFLGIPRRLAGGPRSKVLAAGARHRLGGREGEEARRAGPGAGAVARRSWRSPGCCGGRRSPRRSSAPRVRRRWTTAWARPGISPSRERSSSPSSESWPREPRGQASFFGKGYFAAAKASAKSSLMSSMCSMPSETPDQVGGDAGGLCSASLELLVGGGGGVDDEGLGVADVGEVGGELHVLMNFLPAAKPPLMPKVKTAPKPFLRYLRARGGRGAPRARCS